MAEITILAAVKKSLRVSTTLFDDDIAEIIAAAQKDLLTGGVNLNSATEPLVRQAIKFYCRANFQNGDSKERELNMDRYERLKIQLGSMSEYREDPVPPNTEGENEGGGA